jgi:mannonate dehydratase
MCLTIAEFLPAVPHRLWQLAPQMGVTHAIIKAAPELTGRAHGSYDRDTLASIVGEFKTAGLTVVGLEGDQFDMSRIKLGLPGRDEDLLKYERMLTNMAELGIPLICYNFMAGIGWHRSGATPIRGGAMGTHFKLADMPASLTDAGDVSADQMWDNYAYFARAVMPTAQKLGIRMGLHPDDPPLTPLRGIARIFCTPGAFDRAHALYPAAANAITFCQANFKLMGADLLQLASHFGKRIAFIHVRDVRGTPEDFVELFHDEMEVDQVALFRRYHELGLRVPLRCDHVPTMAGEADDPHCLPGYATMGRLLGVGYFKGILDSCRIPRR